MEAIVVTPVKDSLDTTRQTIEAISKAKGDFRYIIFNDFSQMETFQFLKENQDKYNYTLINIEDITENPSPNYKLVLQHSQQMALEHQVPLILVESDVLVKENTITNMLELLKELKNPGLVGVITVDRNGDFNFPYAQVKKDGKSCSETRRSLSFCCTLISIEFLKNFDFKILSSKKDWFDIYISRQSRKMRFRNYLIKEPPVLHLPHSSRPWKQLKYSNPIKYYLAKILKHRDRI